MHSEYIGHQSAPGTDNSSIATYSFIIFPNLPTTDLLFNDKSFRLISVHDGLFAGIGWKHSTRISANTFGVASFLVSSQDKEKR